MKTNTREIDIYIDNNINNGASQEKIFWKNIADWVDTEMVYQNLYFLETFQRNELYLKSESWRNDVESNNMKYLSNYQNSNALRAYYFVFEVMNAIFHYK